jgi:hypothetical protein
MKLIITAISIALLSACAPNYSEGSRIGVVTKISKKGLIYKSWEGSLNQGGTKTVATKDGSMVVPNAMDFNVSDPEVLKQILDVARSGATVELEYTEWAIAPPSIDNTYVITKVTILDNK